MDDTEILNLIINSGVLNGDAVDDMWQNIILVFIKESMQNEEGYELVLTKIEKLIKRVKFNLSIYDLVDLYVKYPEARQKIYEFYQKHSCCDYYTFKDFEDEMSEIMNE